MLHAQHQLVTRFKQLKTKQGESVQIQIHHTEKTGKAQGSTLPGPCMSPQKLWGIAVGERSSVSSSATHSLKPSRAGKERHLRWRQSWELISLSSGACTSHTEHSTVIDSQSQMGVGTQRRTAAPPVILGEEISLTTDPLAMGEEAAAEAGSPQENQAAPRRTRKPSQRRSICPDASAQLDQDGNVGEKSIRHLVISNKAVRRCLLHPHRPRTGGPRKSPP